MIKSASQSGLTTDIKYRNMGAANVPSNEYLIETVIVPAGGLASVVFSNLSQWAGVYRHLQLVTSARSNRSANTEGGKINFNLDTGGNYRLHILEGNGTSVISLASGPGSTYISAVGAAGNTATAGIFVPSSIDILDAFSTTKNKTLRSLSGGNGAITLNSGLWLNTSAITTITIAPEIGTSWLQGSRFSLYGVTA